MKIWIWKNLVDPYFSGEPRRRLGHLFFPKKYVYLVASLRIDTVADERYDIDPYKSITRSRTWGWFDTKEEAFQACDENWGDLCEAGYYTHAVVEKASDGICLEVCEAIGWWELHEDGNHRVTRPEGFDHTIGFTIG